MPVSSDQPARFRPLRVAVAVSAVAALTALTAGAAPAAAAPGATETTVVPVPKKPSAREAPADAPARGGADDAAPRRAPERPAREAPSGPAADQPAAPEPDAPAESAPAPAPAPQQSPESPRAKTPEKTPKEAPARAPEAAPDEAPEKAPDEAPRGAPAEAPSPRVQDPSRSPRTPTQPSADQPSPDQPTPDRPVRDQPTPATEPSPVLDRPAPGGTPERSPGSTPTGPSRPGSSPTSEETPKDGAKDTVEDGAKGAPGDAAKAGSQDGPQGSAGNSTGDAPKDSSNESASARPRPVIERRDPQTLQAPGEDVQAAKTAAVTEQRPEPATAGDVDALAQLVRRPDPRGPARPGDRPDDPGRPDDRDRPGDRVNLAGQRGWDRTVRQWRPDWVDYDEYYRPVISNPYRDPVRIVYRYRDAPRIVFIPPLSRIVLEVAEAAAYSFTAVVQTAVDAAVNTALNVAVGSFFGGGYFPGVGLPLPPPPRPVLRYDDVPVFVNYSRARYQPFRVGRIVDAGDDAVYGERKVLLDGVTPAWGVWNQTPTGERQFEVHRTQQFPGLDEPAQVPLPGDYPLTLLSDETAQDSGGFTRRDAYLLAVAGVLAAMSVGAVAYVLVTNRRRA